MRPFEFNINDSKLCLNCLYLGQRNWQMSLMRINIYILTQLEMIPSTNFNTRVIDHSSDRVLEL